MTKYLKTFAAVFAAPLIALFILACSPPETIRPDTTAVEDANAGAPPPLYRVVPLSWHQSPDWTVDASNGSATRSDPCGFPEPDIHTWTSEIDAESLPHGSTLLRANLVIRPCGAGRTTFPDNFPVAAISLVDLQGTVVASTNAAQDAQALMTDYVSTHRLAIDAGPSSVSPLPMIDRTLHRVVLRFESEYGPGAFAGMKILGLSVQYSPP